MLKIKNSNIATSAVKPDQYPEERLPEITLFGRSNAGKSSLINALINRKNLARTSSAPGKTRLLNFYRIEAASENKGSQTSLQWHFVDMPGYGYAKVAKTERENWLQMMRQYLSKGNCQMCWQLVDIRHKPSEQDIAMHQQLKSSNIPLFVIANKTDKISKNARAGAIKLISQTLQFDPHLIIPFSAISKEGKDQLLDLVEELLLP